MGANHARIYRSMPEVDLVAIVDTNISSAKTAAEKYSVPYYSSVSELLANHHIEAASVSVPTSLHVPVARELLSAGIHVLVEKPLAPTVEECQELCAISGQSEVIVMVGHVERFNPAVRKLQELIREGKFGDITSIITRRVGLAPPRIRDADVVTDLAVHDIDIANFLIGKQPIHVYANSGYGNLRDRVDFSEIFLNYGTCNAIISVNWLTPLKIRKMSVTGTQGYAELDFIRQELLLFEAPTSNSFDGFTDFVSKYGHDDTKRLPISFTEPLAAELGYFINCVQTGAQPEIGCNEAIAVLSIVKKVLQQNTANRHI
ncbi:MAG: Gfo/Idh/MocA family oxidoreductase [Sulfuricaulis sp.]